MNKFVLIKGSLAVLLMMVIVTTGEPNEQALGPYIVSFDWEEDTKWTVNEPILLEFYGSNATLYSLDGFVKDAPLRENHITIAVGEIYPVSPETMRYASTAENLTLGIKLGFTLYGMEPISISPRIIDGAQGMIGVGYWDLVEETIYQGQWIANNAFCSVNSNIPWGKGTRQILNTIHIEPQAPD